MTIKVLHIINDLVIGGSEMMLYRLLSRMDREMFEPVVLSLTKDGSLCERIEALNVRVFSADINTPLSSLAALRRLMRLASQIKPDLIQGWMYHGSLAGQFVRSCSRRACVLWGIRNSFSVPRNEKRMTAAVIRLGAFMSRLPDGIIYVSHANHAQHEGLGYFNENSFVIPNGFDTTLFAPSPETRAEVRDELGISDNIVLIGLIGRFHPSKDHSNFLRAAILLRNYCNVRFVLCGKGVDSHNPSIKALASELEIGEKLLLLGERHDMPRLMTALDILSSSSSNEAFPNVIGEAMSCALPCVATNVGDVAYLLGETGILTPPRDPETIAQALKKLIDIGHEGRMLLGEAARRRIIDRFSLEAVAKLYESLYRNTVERRLENVLGGRTKE